MEPRESFRQGPEPVPLSANLRTTFAFAFSTPRSSLLVGLARISAGVDKLCQDFLYAPGWRESHQLHACVAPNEVDCKLK